MTDKDDLIDVLSENESELGAMVGNQWEEIAELGGALGEMTTRRNLAESEVRRLEAELAEADYLIEAQKREIIVLQKMRDDAAMETSDAD